jgi:predicted GNAT family acetyltransferase
VLGPADLDQLLDLLDRDPVSDVFVGSRVQAVGLESWRLGAEVWGWYERGRLTAACYSGANLVPVQADSDAVRAFADRAARQGRRCSSIVGPAEAVGPLWRLLEPHWGRAREVRACQPLMAIDQPPAVAPDPGVRLVRADEVDVLLPASVAMFTEEVGVSPIAADGGRLYRARVAELVTARRALARIDDGRVVFKAEIGSATSKACQVQGVWVDPSLRGRGLAVAGMAAVVDYALANVAPVVSLYVNDFNVPAVAAYRHVGFRDVGTFATVLF